MLSPSHIVSDASSLLANFREVYSRRPEAFVFEAREMRHLLFSLGYTDDLGEETEIAAAIEVARTDWTPDEGAS